MTSPRSWLFAVLAVVAAPLRTDAQRVPAGAPDPGPRGPLVQVAPRLRVAGAERPVEVTALDVRVVVHGLHAETTQTLTFSNPNARVLEGELEFPLPDAATVSGFALDVGGLLVDASVVEKHQARVALETEIRRGVDPGLVEQVRGNVYRARVYPIPARGTRTVRLRWVSSLATQGEEAAYHLPLPYPRSPREVAVRVEVVRPDAPPEVSGGFGNVTLARFDDRWVGERRFSGAPPPRDLLVRLPRSPVRLSAVETGPGGDTFFSMSDAVPALAPGGRPPPKRVAIAWDASASRTPEQTRRELDFLDRLLAAWPGVAVDVMIFRLRAEPPRSFPPGARAALLEALRGAVADGGTGLAALDLSVARLPHRDDALWLLLGDGLGTLGDGLPRTGGVPVWAVTGATDGDRALLRHVAGETGGELLDLVALGAPAAVAAVVSPRIRLLRATATAGAADVIVAPGADRGRFEVLGRLVGGEADLSLDFGSGDRVLEQRVLKVRRDGAAPAGERPGPVATAWAQARLDALSVEPDANAAALLELGRRFGLVTAATSLLVLETLEQHLEHGVEPAPGRAALRAEYLARVEERAREKARTAAERLEQVAQRWQRRVEWWKAERRVPAGWRYSERDATDAHGDDVRGRERRVARSAAAPPPSAQAMESPAAPMALLSSPARAESPRAAHQLAGPAAASIAVAPWDPKVPWLAPLRAAAPGAAYEAYLAQREARAGPAFYLDCAEFLLRAGQRELGLRVLSNLAELRLDDPALLRVMAWRLSQAGELELAAAVLEKVLRLRPEEPQSRRDLALVLSELAEARGRPGDAARAIDLLLEVALRGSDRFQDLDLVALMELNRIAARAERRGWAGVALAPRVDPRLRGLLDLDLRVSLSWDADLTDVDLHVVEPTGEHASFSHPATFAGGLVSRDVTQGYGPEEYVIRRAVPGSYAVKAHYYGSAQQRIVGPATLTVTLFTGWGRPEEKREVLTVRLAEPRDLEALGEVTIARR